MEYLRAMVKKDMTVLVAEHDISLMARYCDLCVIMKKGELVAVGDPKKIITEELIEDVYEVSSTVGLDRDGELYILPKKYMGNDEWFE
jgi:iron complex transport system ATP-binding protein